MNDPFGQSHMKIGYVFILSSEEGTYGRTDTMWKKFYWLSATETCNNLFSKIDILYTI